MTPALRNYLLALGETGRAKVRREAQTALRHAWPHRNTDRLRARIVIRANVTTLRNLRTL